MNITPPTTLGGTGPHHPHPPGIPGMPGLPSSPAAGGSPPCCSEGNQPLHHPPDKSSNLFPFLRKINCGTGVNARTSKEPVTPTGKVGTWKTNTSSSNIIACHAALRETFEIPTLPLWSAERQETRLLHFAG